VIVARALAGGAVCVWIGLDVMLRIRVVVCCSPRDV
jgi:hypothetical protein